MFRMVKNIVVGVLLAGLLLALLRAFDYNVIALIEWGINFVVKIVGTVADWFSGNQQFQEITTAPTS